MKWLIIGGGISGIGAAKYLIQQKETVYLSDKKHLSKDTLDILDNLNVKVFHGTEEPSLVDNVNAIVLSPGVSFDNIMVQRAQQQSIPIFSEIDLVLKDYQGIVIAVSGTNGKSTTASMIYHILRKSNIPAVLGGNIGIPLTEIYVNGQLKDILVLEVSSYQIEHSKFLFPTVSVLTSFSFDHINRHKNLENYFKIKWTLCQNTKTPGCIIAHNHIFKLAQQYALGIPENVKIYKISDKDIINVDTLLTKHDKLNATYSLYACAHILQTEISKLIPYLDDFKTLEHRFELVGTILGKSVINDSKSTNVECVIKALENIKEPCLLLIGGQGKGESFKPILQYKDLIAHIFCFGQSGPNIYKELSSDFNITLFQNLKECVPKILDFVSKHPVIILFSPGCASFDEFLNFEKRGEFFKKEISRFLDK